MRFLAVAAVCAATLLAPIASASSPRSGALNVTKECSGFNGGPGSYRKITCSNLAAIEIGSKIIHLQPGAVATPQGSDVVLDLPGPGNNTAFGNCAPALPVPPVRGRNRQVDPSSSA